MRWLAVLCALCAGCDLLFDVHSIEGPPVDAGSAASDARDGGGSNGGGCSAIAMLADDFNDDDFDVLWSAAVNNGNTLVEQGGTAQLEMALPGSYITMISKAYFQLDEGSFTIDLRATGFAADDYIALTLASEQPGYSIQWYRRFADDHITDTMYLSVIVNGNSLPAGSFTFDPVMDRFLRTRVVGARVYFETSQDGTNFTMKETALAGGLGFVQVTLQTFEGDNNPGPFTVFVDTVNDGLPQGTACDVSTLHDTFDSNEPLPQWARSVASGGTSTNQSGQLVMTTDVPAMGAMPFEIVTLEPSAFYDMTHGSVSVDIEQMISTVEASGEIRAVELLITTATGDQLELEQHDGMLVGIATIKNQSSAIAFSIPWNPTAHKWWRIAVNKDAMGVSTAIWSTSPDGKNWTAIISNQGLHGFDRSDITLQTRVVATTPETAKFDNFNVTPP